MINVYPGYYFEFRCIADKCKNNCCIGWEIDIDKDSYERYMNTVGGLGAKLKQNISSTEQPFFILNDERCPFLNSSGLCELILEKGEDFICNICKDHPRFRNFFDEVTEIGIGLACEEAARIILSSDDWEISLKGITASDEDYHAFYEFRNRFYEILKIQDNKPEDKINEIENLLGITTDKIKISEIGKLFLKLEILNEEWKKICEDLCKCPDYIGYEFADDNVSVRLIAYFLFRHLWSGVENGEVTETILFAIISTCIINFITVKYGYSYEEAARIYSAEIEYSEENKDALLRFTEEYYAL